jgi:hypothetical protein
MIWRVVERYSDLAGRPPALAPAGTYAVLDGLFQQALLALSTDGDAVLDGLPAQVRALMPVLLAPAA